MNKHHKHSAKDERRCLPRKSPSLRAAVSVLLECACFLALDGMESEFLYRGWRTRSRYASWVNG